MSWPAPQAAAGLGHPAAAGTLGSQPGAIPDYANPEQMNRYQWYATTGWTKPYPGDSKIYAPDQVPGAYLPASDISG